MDYREMKKREKNLINDLYDYVYNNDYIDREYMLDQLWSIQNYAK